MSATSRPRLAAAIRKPSPAPLTSDKIKHLAGLGLENPLSLTPDQVRELCGSVLAHINRLTPTKPTTD